VSSDEKQQGQPQAKGRQTALGCLAGCLVPPVLIAAPFALRELLLPDKSVEGAALFVALGALIFGALFGNALFTGELLTKRKAVNRAASPVVFYVGLAVYGLFFVGFYLLYVVLLFV
jgi:hypothetical protein